MENKNNFYAGEGVLRGFILTLIVLVIYSVISTIY